jgi:hypothetical protein
LPEFALDRLCSYLSQVRDFRHFALTTMDISSSPVNTSLAVPLINNWSKLEELKIPNLKGLSGVIERLRLRKLTLNQIKLSESQETVWVLTGLQSVAPKIDGLSAAASDEGKG